MASMSNSVWMYCKLEALPNKIIFYIIILKFHVCNMYADHEYNHKLNSTNYVIV